MAKKFENDKGYLIIEMSPEEAEIAGFPLEVQSCMECGNRITDKVYYIAVMNNLVCGECLESWMDDDIYDEADQPDELENYQYRAKLLGMI